MSGKIERLGHIGLRSMRARARDVGGTLRLLSVADGGTEVVARVPTDVQDDAITPVDAADAADAVVAADAADAAAADERRLDVR